MELKDIFEYTGLNADEVKSVDDFKKAFDEKFTTLDQAKSELGRRIGSIETEIKRAYRNNGIDFDQDEIKDKKLEEWVGLGVDKLKNTYEGQIKDLEGKASGGGSKDIEKLKSEYEGQIQSLSKKYSELEDLHNTSKEEWQSAVSEKDNQLKTVKLDIHKKNLMGQLKLKQGISDLEKRGFEATLNEKLRFDFDDKGDFIVTNTNGDRIKDDSKHGEFADPLSAVKSVAVESGVWETNPHGGKGSQGNRTFVKPSGGDSDGKVREVPAHVRANA